VRWCTINQWLLTSRCLVCQYWHKFALCDCILHSFSNIAVCFVGCFGWHCAVYYIFVCHDGAGVWRFCVNLVHCLRHLLHVDQLDCHSLLTQSWPVNLVSSRYLMFLPRDAMHKRGICRHLVFVHLSVRLSVTFVSCAKTNKDIFEIFSPSDSQAILVFPYQTGWRYSNGNPPNGGVECKVGMKKLTIFHQYLAVSQKRL